MGRSAFSEHASVSRFEQGADGVDLTFSGEIHARCNVHHLVGGIVQENNVQNSDRTE